MGAAFTLAFTLLVNLIASSAQFWYKALLSGTCSSLPEIEVSELAGFS